LDIDPLERLASRLIEQSGRLKRLTWEALNEAMPDEAITPERLEWLLNRIERAGVKLVDGNGETGGLESERC
jgi:hypothetical protein